MTDDAIAVDHVYEAMPRNWHTDVSCRTLGRMPRFMCMADNVDTLHSFTWLLLSTVSDPGTSD